MIDATYPGVYVTETSTPNPSIAGTPTSVAAFVGRMPRGPVNDPKPLTSFGGYEGHFDGLNLQSTVSYMVRDFYLNGGSAAVATRVFEPYFPTPAVRRIASAVGEHLAAVGAAEPSGSAASLAAVTAAIAKAGYTTALEQDAAARFEASLQGFAAAHPTATEAEVHIALVAATQAATPQGASKILISAACAVAIAAQAVVDAASTASPSHVLRDAQTAAEAQDRGPASEAAHVVLTALQFANGAPHAGAFAIPYAVEAALQLTQVPKASTDDITAYKEQAARVKQVQDASLAPFATAQSMLALLTASPPEVYHDLTQSLEDGASAMDVAFAATAHLTRAVVALSPDVFTLMAANPGTWGDRITVSVDRRGITPEVADQINADGATLDASDLFNLRVTYVTPDGGTKSEHFSCVTVAEHGGSHRIDRVLEDMSELIALPKADDGSALLPPRAPAHGAKGTGQGGTDSLPLSPRTLIGDVSQKTGIYALDHAEMFNILCIPPDVRDADHSGFGDTHDAVYTAAATYCVQRRAMLILDPPNAWTTAVAHGDVGGITIHDLGTFGPEEARSSVVYFPRVRAADPVLSFTEMVFPACGALAGVWAQTDTSRGVWNAPAGIDASINGAIGLQVELTNDQNETLNREGINCLRTFPQMGSVVWGARTMRGADAPDDTYRYVPTRRLALYVENSILEGTKWTAFATNDESTWSSVRLEIGAFLQGLFAQGAFVGTTASEAYNVTCDASTTTPADQARGILNVRVSFAPAVPAEFITLELSLRALQYGA